MMLRKVLVFLAVPFALGALVAAVVLSYPLWRVWLPDMPATHSAADTDFEYYDPGEHEDRVQLSRQARENLRLVLQPIALTSYWRTLRIPGVVAERPGQSDVGVTTPLSGVVQRIVAVPGDRIGPGDELFTLRLISESLQTSQTELYKAVRDLEINQERIARLQSPYKEGLIPEGTLVELRQQRQRLTAMREAYGQDLQARGLTSEQIANVEQGRFVTELTIRAPADGANSRSPRIRLIPVTREPYTDVPSAAAGDGYELEELKVHLGEHVQAGQTLAKLASHGMLYVEGQAFKQEAPLIGRTAREGWPVRVEFPQEAEADWPPFQGELRIQFLAATIDPNSQTFAFYLSLPNEAREYQRGGKIYRVWRYRPGQRVRLHVAVEQLRDVFVLPAAAVVREGPEVYVFRANGDSLDRKPVHVLLEDRDHVILANDGSITAGNYIAQNGAAQLNRVLKAKASVSHGHGHDHHGHEH